MILSVSIPRAIRSLRRPLQITATPPARLTAQVSSALEVVIHLARRDGVRRLEEIALLHRDEEGMLRASTALSVRDGRLEEGPAAAALATRVTAAAQALEAVAPAPRRRPA